RTQIRHPRSFGKTADDIYERHRPCRSKKIMSAEMHENRERIRIISLFTDAVSLDAAASRVESLIPRGGYVACANVHMTMEAVEDPAFAEVVNAADLVVPDGKPLFLMQKRLGADADA